jgi:hypothetical protein
MWDLASTANSGPEVFARKTGNLLLIYICNFHVLNYFLLIYICTGIAIVEDLGLPQEMEPAISHRIRETLMR